MIFFKNVAPCLCERLHLGTSFCSSTGYRRNLRAETNCSCSFFVYKSVICWICGVVQLSLWSSCIASHHSKNPPWAHLQYFSTAKRIPVRGVHWSAFCLYKKLPVLDTSYINRNLPFVFGVWLLSFSVMLCTFMCVIIYISISSFYLLNSLLYGYIPTFHHII